MSLGPFNNYSQTSLMGAPKMRRLSGPLRDMVAYEKRTKKGLFQEELPTGLYPLEGNFKTAYNFKVTICIVLYCR